MSSSRPAILAETSVSEVILSPGKQVEASPLGLVIAPQVRLQGKVAPVVELASFKWPRFCSDMRPLPSILTAYWRYGWTLTTVPDLLHACLGSLVLDSTMGSQPQASSLTVLARALPSYLFMTLGHLSLPLFQGLLPFLIDSVVLLGRGDSISQLSACR
ncbi:hypothetical protein E2C01_006644 [Portunus trituberculatus]|uniref:Uncharacterized protein n=1 Tax=Portunus trituberculatus TaxID=210409 RepID=A0A5B7CXW1_PORTR|nr:hypothetical protein [Portunus trituberculatus]